MPDPGDPPERFFGELHPETSAAHTPQPMSTETSPETLIACFQPTFQTSMRRWRVNLKSLSSHMKDFAEAEAALCISEPGTFAAVAIEVHSSSPCTLYLATSDDAVGSLEPHFQTLWRSLREVALSTNGTAPPLDSPAVDVAVEVYDFAWATFYDRFAPEVEYFCTQFFPQVSVPETETISDEERRDLQNIGDLFDVLRKTVTRAKPANAELRNIVSTLGLLSAAVRPHLDDSALHTLIRRSAQVGKHLPIKPVFR